MKKTIIISLFLLLLVPFINVSAASISDVSAAYGYRYYDTNKTLHAYQWFGTYSANNLTKYNYELPATWEDYGVQMQDFGIRFHIDGNFKSGKNYTITFTWANYNGVLSTWEADFSHLIYYSKCRVSSWSSTAQDDTYCYDNYNMSYRKLNGNQDILQITITFSPKIDFYGTSIYFYHDNNPYEYYYSSGWEIYDISYSDTTDSSQAIINNQNQNTQNIINNQNTNSQNIINNQNTNTQNIINNQNQNAQAIIDSNKTCELVDKSSISIDGSFLNSSGGLQTNASYGITDYFKIDSRSIIKIVTASSLGISYCFYNVNKTLLSCRSDSSTSAGDILTIPASASYFRASINKNQNKPTYEICKNGSQAVVDALTDETPPDTSSLGNSAGWLPPGPVDSILNLPLALLNNLSVSLSSTCQAVNLPIPYLENQTITLPCLTTIYSQITDFSSFWNWVGWLVSGIILYKYFLHLYKWVDDTLTFRENNWIDNWGGV